MRVHVRRAECRERRACVQPPPRPAPCRVVAAVAAGSTEGGRGGLKTTARSSRGRAGRLLAAAAEGPPTWPTATTWLKSWHHRAPAGSRLPRARVLAVRPRRGGAHKVARGAIKRKRMHCAARGADSRALLLRLQLVVPGVREGVCVWRQEKGRCLPQKKCVCQRAPHCVSSPHTAPTPPGTRARTAGGGGKRAGQRE